MNKIINFTTFAASVISSNLPLEDLLLVKNPGQAHNSNEYTGKTKLDPRDFEQSVAKSVGNYTTEKVDLIGTDVTILTSYEYDSGFLRVFGTLDKKFKWHEEPVS